MATPLSPAHRSWRMKVFGATWLSYVGFYFCRKPFSAAKSAIGTEMGWSATTLANIWAAYLVAYAIGQFLASQTNVRLGPRRNVLLGMGLSVAVTAVMGFAADPWIMGGCVFVNGIAQATGWSGNVGTMAGWFHKHERGRVMGLWSTNFTMGALASGWVMGWVLSMHDTGMPEPWRWCFFTGSIVLAVVWIQFYFLQRTKPEDVGLPPVDDPATPEDESKDVVPRTRLPREAWIAILLVGGFYFCAKLIRYAVWSWSAYFLQENYKMSGAEANVYATVFELCGLPGVLLTGYISDKYFQSRRAGVALWMMIGMTATTLLLVLFGSASVTAFTILLGAVGFTLYGPDALLSGAGAMDIGGRHLAAFATAVIAGFGALGPIVQELVIARLYDAKGGDLGAVFALLFASAALGTAFCLVLYLRGRKTGRGI